MGTIGGSKLKQNHAKASIIFRNNHIAILRDEQGHEHSEHHAKAALLGRSFKQRLGYIVPTFNLLNLDSLLPRSNGLLFLEQSLTKVEIGEAVKNLPPNGSPGLDGLNSDFVKACWETIAHDLCAFF